MTLAPASPSLTAFGATPRDILMTVGAADPVVWASGAALGLVSGDVIDAICVDDGGNGVYNAGVDRVLFSLAPGSPTLTTLSAGAADLLRAGPAVNYSASRLGLQATDDVDALKCPTNDRDGDTFFDIADNCPDTNSFDQTDTDSDGLGNVCDSDDDNDGVADAAEGPCGSDPLDITPPLSRPERLDGAFATVDDDGDTMVDEPLPVGAANFDCDGDGYRGDGPGAGNISEKRIYTAAGTANDQDPCGNTGWPADLTSAGPSANRITLTDLTSFIAPLPRHFNTDPGDAGYDVRWDLVTGNGAAPPKDISLTDLTNLTTLFPPMLGSAKAFGGPVCPWPP